MALSGVENVIVFERRIPRFAPAVVLAAAPLFGCVSTRHADGFVMLVWDQPRVQERDAEPIVSGYRISFWSAADGRPTEIDVPDPQRRRYRIQGLPPGEYYFSMTAYDERGVQSELSNVVRKVVR
jgi:hypothetical protein